MQKFGWVKKRLKILRSLEKTPTTYVKFLLWVITDTPRILYRYKAYKYSASFANGLLRDVRVKLDYGEFITVDGYSLWILTCYEERIVKILKGFFLEQPRTNVC